MRTAVALLCVVGPVLGCGNGGADARDTFRVELPGTPVAVSELRLNGSPPPAAADAAYSGYAAPTRLVLRSQDGWANAWGTIYHGVDPLPALPAVDFTTEMVVVVATGIRGGGCHITVTNAALDAGTLRIGVVETTPGAGCAVPTVMTQPAGAARMARHDGPVEFVDEIVAIRCE